jgi:hypothetical protein
MQEYGARAIDIKRSKMKKRDIIVMPLNNTNPLMIPKGKAREVTFLRFNASSYATTMNNFASSGFYASEMGPLPFRFGPAYKEGYIIVVVIDDIW